MNKFSKALSKNKEKIKKTEKASGTIIHGKNEIRLKGAVKVNPDIFLKECDFDKVIVSIHSPRTNISEQYRTLRTNIMSLNGKKDIIVVTSSIEGEGKTVTCINLAYTFALNRDKKILLLDSDLRRSGVKKYIKISDNVRKRKSFTDILRGDCDIDEVVLGTHLNNFHIIPANYDDYEIDDAVELLEGDNMKNFMEKIRGYYDHIIIDTPPVLPVTDASVIGKYGDILLLVFRSNVTERNTILHAEDILKQAGVGISGYVMTAVEAVSHGKNDYYYYAGYRY